jgi:peroxiredoxin
MVSNGEKGFLYQPAKDKYLPVDVPNIRTAAEDLSAPLGELLWEQNPSLIMALSSDASAELTRGAGSLDRGPDVKIDATSYPSLQIQSPGSKMQVLIDPRTHLVRQLSLDIREHLISKGVPQVNQASETIDYTKSTPNVQVAEADFNWTPPANAALIKPIQQAADGDIESPAAGLVGKPAPPFTLTDMKGQQVKLADQKGHVVVLDFWATWCAPCVRELPLLDQISQQLSGQGLVLLAINQGEEKDVVQKFLDKEKLSLHVLLDEKGTINEQYLAEAIPETLVIDKKGIVSYVAGFGLDSEQKLRDAIKAAMK